MASNNREELRIKNEELRHACFVGEVESEINDARRVVATNTVIHSVCAKLSADEESALLRPRAYGDPAGRPRPWSCYLLH